MRLIDADALREIVEDGLRNNPHKDGFSRVCHQTEYTHFLDVICKMPTITPPPNDPMTLDELREMDGEPVWVEALDSGASRWSFVDCGCELVRFFKTRRGVSCEVIARHFKTYGKTWLAYRRKPEEG